ncbi:zinc finger BED domain-containing protein 1-like, partial [Aphis craccivora]
MECMAPPKSNNWIHFKKLDHAYYAVCKDCGQNVAHSGNTSNLRKHLNKHNNTSKLTTNNLNRLESSVPATSSTHNRSPKTITFSLEDSEPEECVDCPLSKKKNTPSKQPIIEAFNRISSYSDIRWYRRPFTVIEGEGFKRLLHELVLSYKIPSVSTNKLKSRLSVFSYASLTFDAWTETMSEKSFLGVTVHFLDGISLKSYCLAIPELKERHSIAAVNKVFGKNKQTSCFAHTINLVATNTLGQTNITPLISKVREIVKWVKNSVINSDLLRKKQFEAGISEGNMNKLILDVPTRWNSVYYMVDRFIDMIKLISPLLLDNYSAPLILNAIEIDILRQLLGLLKPLEFVTRESSGENYITISKIIPMISCLTKQLAMIVPRFDVICEVKDTLHTELIKRFEKDRIDISN